MRLSRFLAGLVASALLIAAFSLGGCAGRPAPAVDLPARPEFPPNAPVPAAEIEKARSVLERYLIAYSKGDVETVLKTVPRAKAEGYRASGEQMARSKA